MKLNGPQFGGIAGKVSRFILCAAEIEIIIITGYPDFRTGFNLVADYGIWGTIGSGVIRYWSAER